MGASPFSPALRTNRYNNDNNKKKLKERNLLAIRENTGGEAISVGGKLALGHLTYTARVEQSRKNNKNKNSNAGAHCAITPLSLKGEGEGRWRMEGTVRRGRVLNFEYKGRREKEK